MLNRSPSSEISHAPGQDTEAIDIRIGASQDGLKLIDQALPEQTKLYSDLRDRTMIDDAMFQALNRQTETPRPAAVTLQPTEDLTVESARKQVTESLDDSQGYVDA